MPLTVLHKKGLLLNGSHPALLTVYGAYGISLETGFEPERLVLLDRGWVIAFAHVRGGGELGRRCNAIAVTGLMFNPTHMVVKRQRA